MLEIKLMISSSFFDFFGAGAGAGVLGLGLDAGTGGSPWGRPGRCKRRAVVVAEARRRIDADREGSSKVVVGGSGILTVP